MCDINKVVWKTRGIGASLLLCETYIAYKEESLVKLDILTD